jgi:hypothetical protein
MDSRTQLRQQLREAGFSPIPVAGKQPTLPGWPSQVDANEHTINLWETLCPYDKSTGIITRNSPGLDIDFKDEDAAEALEELARERFDSRGPILVRIGQAPKRLIPFRTNVPFKKIRRVFVAPSGPAPDGKDPAIEILGDGQQFVAFGIHPNTQQPYRWHGGQPGEIPCADLPYISEQEAAAYVEAATPILLARGYKLKKGLKRKGKAPSSDESDARSSTPEASQRRVAAALKVIPNDNLEWDDWNDVGMAAWRATGGSEAGLQAFMEWSAKSVKHAPEATAAKWAGYHRSPPTRIGAGTLFWLAKQEDPDWESPEILFGAKAQPDPEPEPEPEPAPQRTLDELHGVCSRWLGEEYDLDVMDAVVTAAAAEGLQGDPLWLLVISGPGNTKTETVQTLSGCGAYITSTIQSEGALLSASSRKERSKAATGGLLRKIGDRGILVIKDVTSILSSDRNVRASVLAAIREIYDGKWERNVGTDGGQTLTWTGRIAVIGAVTTAWDSAHAVVAAMGDRFVLIRSDSRKGRKASGSRAIRNTGNEKRMREELAAAVAGVVQHASQEEIPLTEAEESQVLNAADITTLARTAVERDYAGEIIDAHAPEMPTRFAKQLTQMVRGGVAVGMSRERGMQLAIRCARDSIPPLRLEILLDVARHSGCRPGDVRKRLDKPWRTVKREMEALNMLGLLSCDEETRPRQEGGKDETVWRYSLNESVDHETLLTMAGPPRRPDWADFG